MNTESGESNFKQSLEKGIKNILDVHGYGFQYAALRLGNELFQKRKSSWMFQAAELPVQGSKNVFVSKILQKPCNTSKDKKLFV